MSDTDSNQVQQRSNPRVLVVENDDDFRIIHQKNLTKWGYEVYIAQGLGQALIQDAIAKARQHRCHFAVVDLHLLDDYDDWDLSGLDLMDKIRPTESIIFSGAQDFKFSQDAIKKGALAYIGKSDTRISLQNVLAEAEGHCAGRSAVQMTWEGNLTASGIVRSFFPNNREVPADEVDDLLVRLFSGRNGGLNDELTTLKLTLLGEPSKTTRKSRVLSPSSGVVRPHSVVLLAYANHNQPVIVKLARAQKVEKEVANYTQVRDQIGGRYCPNLDKMTILWDMGGAVYTLLGWRGLQTFEQAYRHGSPSKINQVLDTFFTETWSYFYSHPLKETTNLLEGYKDVLGRDWLDHLTQLPYDLVGEYANAGWKHAGLPNPIEWIGQKDRQAGSIPTTRLAVTHGDLHGDNLLVDGNNAPWVIDYERTGPGPILQDFVELESDISNRMAALPKQNLAATWRVWALLAQPRSLDENLIPAIPQHGLKKALEVIGRLRNLAARSAGDLDAYPYVWGLLINALFRAHLHLKVSHHEEALRTLLKAAILCHRLDHWDEPWPPAEWDLL